MTVANPREVPEYELNPLELQVRKSDGITKVAPFLHYFQIPALLQVYVSPPIKQIVICQSSFFLDADHVYGFRLPQQGTYQVAKWNGTKVSVKILDKESYSDPERMYVLRSPYLPKIVPIKNLFYMLQLSIVDFYQFL